MAVGAAVRGYDAGASSKGAPAVPSGVPFRSQ